MKEITGHIVDIPGKQIYPGKVTIQDNRIKSIEKLGEVPSGSPYILPGFIDSHVHIESTLLTPENFAPFAAEHGTTGVVTDPHEIANVLGIPGVDYMIQSASKCHFNFHFGAPSCVPSTTFETSGATLDSNDVKSLIARDDIYGLCEMMNVPGLVFKDSEVLAKLEATRAAGKPIDGHMPGASDDAIKECAAAGISTDHECSEIEDAVGKLEQGIKILIREGSAACNYDILAPLLGEDKWADMLMFCTDDKYVNELKYGYIDELVRESIRRGYPLWNVLKAACINPVKHFGLNDGMLREGDKADFILVDSLEKFNILSTYVDGIEVALNGKATDAIKAASASSEDIPNNFNALPLCEKDLFVEPESNCMRVITATDGSLLTGSLDAEPLVENGNTVSDVKRDILKIAVYNRYEQGAKPAIGFIQGFALKEGAIACSIGHDSHNITAIGVSDEEIVKVINTVVACKGGMAVSDGKKVESLPLEVAGLMSSAKGEEVASKFDVLLKTAKKIGCPFNAPFMTMAFMPLPVIPELKITDKSLFDVQSFDFCSLFK